ncbi:hybrid sensor histidine kinase/response regulator [Kordiimonas aestuarii]|uniref:hybrid sensor histidine kinase/response regulator n=1 Tax=Kordiimonas aestuarii TaxID=1005925 RepID=UPI0021CE4DE5|nr:hybrid sensor histidine kinase/response regulator [Kordiimonas aestuarii]
MTKRTWQNLTLFFAAMLLVIAFAYVQEQRLSHTLRKQVSTTLHQTVASTQEAAAAWKQRHIAQMASISQHPVILREGSKLLGLQDSGDSLTSDTLEDLRAHMAKILANYGYLGFFIIAPDGTSIASMRDNNIGGQNLIRVQAPELFSRALAGDITISQPVHTDVPVLGTDGVVSKAAPTMFALAPLRDRDGNVIAVFTLRINPLNDFAAIFARGRMGLTGETYAFNKHGLMISESRFTDTLELVGLLRRGEASMLNIPVHDPGYNAFDGSRDVDIDASPPTAMAKSALAGGNGENLVGYRNYLGQAVVGAWVWDNELGYGIASEVGKGEAFSGLNTSIATIRTFAGCIVLLLAILAYVQHRNRHRRQQQELAVLAALDQAKQANQAKMVFLSSMSHELRTPLNAVIGFAQLLLEEESVKENPEHARQIGNIQESGEHLLSLVDEILEFAKLDLGRLSFQYSKTSIANIVTESIEMVEPSAKAGQIVVHLENDDLSELPQIWTDPTRVKQVLLNLLSNAVKYNSAGGYVSIHVTVGAGNVRFQVDDSGRGITKEDMPNLWEPFTRLGTDVTSIEGSGIGLAFSRKLIEELDGDMGVSSTPGKGSRFWFSLPLRLSATLTGPQKTDAKGADGGKATPFEDLSVLCIEDLEINQDIVRRMLIKLGITQMSFAYDGNTALEKLKSNKYNLILLDINLPDMDGFEFNRRKIAMGLAQQTPVIALTASTSPETRKMAKEYGIAGFVAKPIKLDHLMQTIAEHTRAH